MFGIFHGLFTIFAVAANGTRKNKEIANRKKVARLSGQYTYTDKRGEQRLISNNHRAKIVNYNGFNYIVDATNGRMVVDYIELTNQEKRQKAIDNGATVYDKLLDDSRKSYYRRKYGHYKFDVKTDQLVIEIWVNGYQYYMNPESGHLIRISDFYKKKMNSNISNHMTINTKFSKDEIIQIFNQRQDLLRECAEYKDMENNWDWMSRLFYCRNDYFSAPTCYIDSDKTFRVEGMKNGYVEINFNGYDPTTGKLI